MEKNYDFRKDILSCSDKGVSSTNGIARKRTGFFSLFTKVLPLFALLFCAELSAQLPTYPPFEWFSWKYALEWDPTLDCIRETRVGEEIVESNCITACKGSTVEYYM